MALNTEDRIVVEKELLPLNLGELSKLFSFKIKFYFQKTKQTLKESELTQEYNIYKMN